MRKSLTWLTTSSSEFAATIRDANEQKRKMAANNDETSRIFLHFFSSNSIDEMNFT